MKTGYRGTFVISWTQTEVDGLRNAPVSALGAGSSWCWRGEALRVDGPPEVLLLEPGDEETDIRRRAAKVVHRLVGAALAGVTPDAGEMARFAADDPLLDMGFEVTDGHRAWRVTLIDVARGRGPLLMFVGAPPPEGKELWVVREALQAGHLNRIADQPTGVICFTPGTRIRCADGDKPVQDLREGDRIQTRDNGEQEILWIGSRRITGARLHAMPEMRPVRIRAGAFGLEVPEDDLIVSPRHRLLVRGVRARELFNADEVLVRAEDLIDHRRVVLDRSLREVTYVHLLLERHEVVWANGVETESFHPAAAPLEAIEAGQRARLLEMFPQLEADPGAYGDYARRTLSDAEAAILRGVAA